VATKIPDDYQKAFKSLVDLPEKDLEALVGALRVTSPTLLVTDMSAGVAQTTGIAETVVRTILRLLGSLARGRAAAHQSVEVFLPGVRRTLAAGQALTTDELEKHWPRISRHIADALNTKAISISSKAMSVLVSNERVLCNSRVLSDMRPVFDDDIEPAGFLILHQLKLAFHDNDDYDRTSYIYLALERSDLVRLKDSIDRALKKHSKIEALARKCELPVLSTKAPTTPVKG
jgi:hypothetical protein